MAIEVRRASASDYAAVAPFIEEAYADLAPYKGRDRWDWQFLRNPFCDPALRPSVWIALDGDRIVGQIAVQGCGLSAAGRDYPAGWIVDVMILKSYRGLGLGHRLYSGAAESGLALITLTMAAATRRMAERLGAITLPEMRRWTRVERPTADDVARFLAAKTGGRPRLSRAANLFARAGGSVALSLAARAAAAVHDLGAPSLAPGGLVFAPVERFGPETDVVWTSVRDRFAGVPRTSQHLNWRFVECPGLRYERFVVTRDGQTVGYLVLRETEPVELRHGVLVDALALNDDREIWDALVAFACRRFRGATAGVEAAFSTEAAAGALRRARFVPTKTLRPTIVCADAAILADLARAKTWFFDKGDHDWDQIHVA